VQIVVGNDLATPRTVPGSGMLVLHLTDRDPHIRQRLIRLRNGNE
jgi:hypothetical protein